MVIPIPVLTLNAPWTSRDKDIDKELQQAVSNLHELDRCEEELVILEMEATKLLNSVCELIFHHIFYTLNVSNTNSWP